ncbi:MAG: 4-hydroxy-tetrahydrodipicolinate reductase [Clostridia bacterium]|nr:4-hydroxy-tetrahydrodipicolinate reductase [Clostridia bacterium]
MTNVLLSGANGFMGRAIASLAKSDPDIKICAGIDINTVEYDDFPIYKTPEEFGGTCDAIIDFSHVSAFDGILNYAVKNKIPVIFATTGLSEEQKKAMFEASKVSPIFYSANMSVGVNLLIDLVKRATEVLQYNYDIEIVEKHHNRKLDAPSGTALAIADAIAETRENETEYMFDRHSVRRKRGENEVGIQAVRGGTIVGEHDVIFAGHDEIIEIKHEALSREIFAAGALRAAKFMKGKPAGMYNMNDTLK